MKKIYLALLGFSGGATVGAGIVAFFTILGVVARVIDIGKTQGYEKYYKIAVILGALLSTYMYMFDFSVNGSKVWLTFIGLFMGAFIGMVASALAEMLNIFPFLTFSMGINRWVYPIIMAIIFGKVIGSLIYWTIPGFY
ncbi:MAG TPA: stage V sporulation protein AB [Clostridia bacterium]|nr:stage V sporulation protein AB [Clostridia bacterium]